MAEYLANPPPLEKLAPEDAKLPLAERAWRYGKVLATFPKWHPIFGDRPR